MIRVADSDYRNLYQKNNKLFLKLYLIYNPVISCNAFFSNNQLIYLNACAVAIGGEADDVPAASAADAAAEGVRQGRGEQGRVDEVRGALEEMVCARRAGL